MSGRVSGRDEGVERLDEHVLGDLDAVVGDGVDVCAIDDGLVHEAALIVVELPIQLLGMCEQAEAVLNECCAEVQVVRDVLEVVLESLAVLVESQHPCSDLLPWHGSVGEDIEEVLLLPFDRCQLSEQVLSELAGDPVVVVDGSVNLVSDVGCEVAGELHGGVVQGGRFLGVVDGDVWRIADGLLSSTAEEVVVDAT